MHLRAEMLLQRWFHGRRLTPLCLASGLGSWWGMINFKWCTALWIAGDSSPLPKPLLRMGKEGRKSLGQGAMWHPGKLNVWLAADLSWTSCTGSRPWHSREGAVRIRHAWLSHPSLFPAPSVAQGGICTWASRYFDLLAWTPHPHTLSHPTSLCERSTLAGNSGLLSCSNTHQQYQAQSGHLGWVWFIAVKRNS